MHKAENARTTVIFRAVMLLLTVALLLFGVINFNQKINRTTPENPFLAVEGDGFVHVTYKSAAQVPEQPGLRFYFPSVLVDNRLQVLLQVFGRANLPDGTSLTVYWTLQDYFRDEKVLHYSLSSKGSLVNAWQEQFSDYSDLFTTVVDQIGVGGTLQINYLPTQEQESANSAGRTMNHVVVAAPVPAPPAYYAQVAAAMLFLVVGFFVYFSAPGKRTRISESLYITCIAFFALLTLQLTNPDTPMHWVLFWLYNLALLITPALLLHFLHSLYLETGVRNRKFQPWILYTPAALLLAGLLVVVVSYIIMEPVSLLQSKITLAEYGPFTLARLIAGAYFALATIFSMLFLVRISNEKLPYEAMQQFRWVFWGISIGVLPFATVVYFLNPVFSADNEVVNLAVSIALFVTPVSLGLSVLSRRFVDVEVIFKRGFIYFSSSFLLFAIYLGLMFGLRSLSGDITTETIVIVSGGMILLSTLFSHRVKEQVQGFFDRFLHRDFFNFRRTLHRFSQELNYERNLESLLGKISEHIQKHFAIDQIIIFIASANRQNFVHAHSTLDTSDIHYINTDDSEQLKQLFSRGNAVFADKLPAFAVVEELRSLGIVTVIPFLSRGEVIGFMCLGSNSEGDPLNTDDIELLVSFTDRAGAFIDNALLYMDIETRAEAMRILKEYNENILESVDSGICAVDRRGIVQSWNTALEEAFDVPRDEAIGRNVLSLLPHRLSNVIEPYLLGGSDTGRFHTLYKIFLMTSRGEEKIFNISFSPLGEHSTSETIIEINGAARDLAARDQEGTVLIFDDVTEGVRMEEKLQQQDKLAGLGLLSAGVAHEVNTPLAGIAGYVQMLQKRMQQDTDKQEILGKIEKQVFRASRIINNLLNFSRQGPSESEEIDINQLITDSLLLIENQLRSKDITVSLDLAEDLAKVRGDRVKLQQVLLNLILNARDSIKSSGSISMSTLSGPGNSVKCRVEDTGSGIPKSSINKIFDPFFTTKKMGEGTGLGLSVSYGIIQEHKGEIDVESEEGEGTAFIITLPGV